MGRGKTAQTPRDSSPEPVTLTRPHDFPICHCLSTRLGVGFASFEHEAQDCFSGSCLILTRPHPSGPSLSTIFTGLPTQAHLTPPLWVWTQTITGARQVTPPDTSTLTDGWGPALQLWFYHLTSSPSLFGPLFPHQYRTGLMRRSPRMLPKPRF